MNLISVSAENLDQSSTIIENSDVRTIDISFGFRKIIAAIENSGSTEATVDVTFSVSKDYILPSVLGHYNGTIPAGETIQVFQTFGGFGLYRFYVRLDLGGYVITKGFWFILFGIELQ